ncbi:MAG: TIGR02757 family protein [Bacteroidales bacterium]
MTDENINIIRRLSKYYNNDKYFQEDPIIFPKHFAELYKNKKANLKDVEISGVIATYLAWGKRNMIVRDAKKAMDEMSWKPYDYVMTHFNPDINSNNDKISLHRTIMWSDFTRVCENLKRYYLKYDSIERLSTSEIRTEIYGQKPSPSAANKKIHLMRRWFVRNDGIVDLGIWKNINPIDLIIPLDVHVHRSALSLEMTSRKNVSLKTATEITTLLKLIFPKDPILGDFGLFTVGAVNSKNHLQT